MPGLASLGHSVSKSEMEALLKQKVRAPDWTDNGRCLKVVDSGKL